MHSRREYSPIHIPRHAQTLAAMRVGIATAWRPVGVATFREEGLQSTQKGTTKQCSCRSGSVVATLAFNTYRHMECWCDSGVDHCCCADNVAHIQQAPHVLTELFILQQGNIHICNAAAAVYSSDLRKQWELLAGMASWA